MFPGGVTVTSLKILQVAALTPLFISSHPIIQEKTQTVGSFCLCVLVCTCVCSTSEDLHMHAVCVILTSPVIWKVSGLVFENSIPHLALYLY